MMRVLFLARARSGMSTRAASLSQTSDLALHRALGHVRFESLSPDGAVPFVRVAAGRQRDLNCDPGVGCDFRLVCLFGRLVSLRRRCNGSFAGKT